MENPALEKKTKIHLNNLKKKEMDLNSYNGKTSRGAPTRFFLRYNRIHFEEFYNTSRDLSMMYRKGKYIQRKNSIM